MSFDDIPDELLVEILNNVPGIEKLYSVSKKFYNIVMDIKMKTYKNPTKYIEEFSHPVFFLLYHIEYHEAIWNKATVKGDIYLIKCLYELGYKFNVDKELRKAAERGYKDLVDFFIEQGARKWDEGMSRAARGGHKELINFFIDLGAENWNQGMKYAAEGGNKELVDFFRGKGAGQWYGDIEMCIAQAAKRNHKDLVDYLIKLGAKKFDRAMAYAAQKGHKNLVEYFIDLGANDWNWAMACAAQGGHGDLIEYFINLGANDWDWAMKCAARGGYKNLVEFFIEKGAINFNEGILFAEAGEHYEVAEFLWEKNKSYYQIYNM